MQVFQTLVTRWISRCFGDESSKDKRERTHRFLEEALELGQAAGATQDEAHALVEYVYGREAGKPDQEVGGVLLTLAGFCSAHGLELHRCAAAEIGRVNRPEVLEKCRIKQAAKKADPLASPLPGQALDFRTAETERGKPVPSHIDTRTYTDAVGTTGGKATVSHLQRGGTNPAPRTKKPDFTPPGQGQ